MADLPVHINLAPERKEWMEAVYGEEVRAANVSAFVKIENQLNDTVDKIIGAVNEMHETAETAQDALDDAAEVLEKANTAIDTANQATDAADATLQRAEGTVVEAQGWSDMAKSWAIGEGNVREDESSNNSKYFAQRAALEYQNAKNEADRAKQYSSITQPDFLIQDNRLYYKAGTGVQFVTSGNRLYWKITA